MKTELKLYCEDIKYYYIYIKPEPNWQNIVLTIIVKSYHINLQNIPRYFQLKVKMINIYKNTRKEDFLNLLTELGEIVNPDVTTFELKTKNKAREIFKENLEMVVDLLNLIVGDRRSRVQNPT